MSYLALARKWRPRNFSELVGQSHVRTALENALGQGHLHPALLFSGTRGVGKTTLARIISRSLNCETGVTATPCGECSACREIEEGRFVDLIEIDAASRTKVEDTRELLDNVPYAPARGRFKVYLIDEVHMLSKHSFNALLKTLEEPPGHVQFLFATTDPQKLPITILSRCLQFHLKRISVDDIAQRMRFILGEENIQAEDDGLRRLARAADGSLRDGLSLLDQAIAFGGGQVTDDSVRDMLGSIERRDLLALASAVADQDSAAAWQAIEHIAEQGLDFAEVLEEFCRLWQRLAVGQQVPEALDELEQADLGPLLERFSAADLQVFYQIAVNARRDLDWAPDPRSGFEMTVLRTLAFLPDQGPAAGAAPAGGAAPRASVAAAAKPATAAPVQARATAAPQPAPAAQPAPSLDGVQWNTLIKQLDFSGSTEVVAQGCRIAGQEEQQLTLEVSPQVQALCTASVETRMREALRQHFSRPDLVVKFERPAKTDSGESVEDIARSPEEKFLALPSVQKAIDMFDAEIQPGSFRMHSDAPGDNAIH